MNKEQFLPPPVNAPSAIHRALVEHYQNFRSIAAGRFFETTEFALFQRFCISQSKLEGTLPQNITLKVFSAPSDLLRLADDGYEIGTAAQYVDAIASVYPGGQLYVLIDGKSVAHYSRVIADRRDPNFGPYIPGIGTKSDICIGPCYTYPDFRGQGLYVLALNAICSDARENGTKTAFIYSATANSSSIKGILKADFKSIAKITRRRWLLWTMTRVTLDQGQPTR